MLTRIIIFFIFFSVRIVAQEAPTNPDTTISRTIEAASDKKSDHHATIKEVFKALEDKKVIAEMKSNLALFKDDQKKNNLEKNSTSEKVLDLNRNHLIEEPTLIKKPDQEVMEPLYNIENRPFYNNYLLHYYPKANFIRWVLFPNSQTKEIAIALRDVIDMLTYEPWFYIADAQEKCQLDQYWEFIIDQLAMLNTFLRQARVDLLSDVVYHSRFGGNPFGQHIVVSDRQEYRRTKNLFLHLKDVDNQLVGDFYALCFDYLVKMFNEGILSKDITKVDRYFNELEYVLGKLRATPYEEQYQESLKTCKELVSLLEERVVDDQIAEIDHHMKSGYGPDNDRSRKKY